MKLIIMHVDTVTVSQETMEDIGGGMRKRERVAALYVNATF